MFCRIENYVVNTDEIAAISLWKKNVEDEVYYSFPIGEVDYIDDLDDEYYCILVDFKGMHGEDESEEIKLFVKTSEEAEKKFNEAVSEIMRLSGQEPKFEHIPINVQGFSEIPVFQTKSNLFENDQ